MGTSTVIYVSLPDTTSTCFNLSLPTLPAGYAYNCVTQQNLRNTDGTGWIPVNFQRISSNSPISQLPIDPVNTTTTGNYYTYVTGGSWELSSNMESLKQKSITGFSGTDGGVSLSSYEIGNNLKLIPSGLLEWKRDISLVGYWTFDEGSGSAVEDYSGNNYDATWFGGSLYSDGKVGTYAGQFNGSNYSKSGSVFTDYGTANKPFSFVGWVKLGAGATSSNIIFAGDTWCLPPINVSNWKIRATSWVGSQVDALGTTDLQPGVWYNFATTWDPSGLRVYLNGVLEKSTSMSTFSAANSARVIYVGYNNPICAGASGYLNGFADDIRVYNRSLSAQEILYLYNSFK
jgi:hypothetical protein